MKSICFFCHFHNGDIFHIKSFLKDIENQLDAKYYIAHPNNPIITKDLDFEYINLPMYWSKDQNIDEQIRKKHQHHLDIVTGKEHTKFIETDECLYVNTWIGGYFSSDNEFNGECSLRGFHKMFSNIYSKINEVFGTQIEIKTVDEYHPFIDYSKYNVKSIDKFIKTNTNEKILICNGPALSYQTTYNSDMSEIINPLASKNPDKIFILTKKYPCDLDNVFFTDDIINSGNCDLNEISYISKYCYLVVGRNSGPFCFTLTDENINSEHKKFLAFGSRETDCLPYGIEIQSSFVFEYFSGVSSLSNTISEML